MPSYGLRKYVVELQHDGQTIYETVGLPPTPNQVIGTPAGEVLVVEVVEDLEPGYVGRLRGRRPRSE